MASKAGARVLREVEMLARLHTKSAIDKLAHLMEHAESEAVQMQAADKLLDRGWGRARTTISVEDPTDMSDEALERTLQEKLTLALAGHPRGGAAGSGDRSSLAGAEAETGPGKPSGMVH